MIEQIKEKVYELLKEEASGHGIDHINRVYNLAVKFALEERANVEIVSIAALLHDVDDYKIVGKENADKYLYAKDIMNAVNVAKDKQELVIGILSSMGYSRYLRKIRPKTLEGMCVSDADMCDGMGTSGLIRSTVYTLSTKGSGVIFDKNIFPIVNISASEYGAKGTTHDTDGVINHFFEKMLKLKNLMMCKAGRKEAEIRHEFMVIFLKEFFREEDNQEWQDFLDNYLEELNK